MKANTCKGCGITFLYHRKKAYCSPTCTKAGQRYTHRSPVNCRVCSKPFVPHSDAVKCCSRKCSRLAPRRYAICNGCGVEFGISQGKQKKIKHCSIECRRKTARDNPVPKAPKYSKIESAACALCGKTHTRRATSSRFCSGCLNRWDYHLLRVMAKGGNETQCTGCGVPFSRYPGTKTLACSKQCSMKADRADKARRRAACRDGERLDPLEVFMRDGWHCSYCKCSTPSSSRGTLKANAPELDHIVPLARGGKHTRANTQLLCRKCNGIKGVGALPSLAG
jgi:hypothetical protein